MFFLQTKQDKKIEQKNANLRKKYDSNDKGYKDKCKARMIVYNSQKLNGICYLCRYRKANCRHHPDYNKPKYIIPLCKSCHTRLHHLIKINKVRKEDKK